MRKIVFLICIAIITSGCLTLRQMERGLGALEGKNIQTAFDVLGYPEGSQVFGSDTVYYWERLRSGSRILPQISTSIGYPIGYPVFGSTTVNQAIPMDSACRIKLITDSNGIIKKWEYDGSRGSCAKYIGKLNKYSQELKDKQ